MSEQTIAVPEVGPEAAPSRTQGRTASQSFWLEALKWAFSFPAMLGAFLVGAAFYCGRAFVVDPDLWWHIKTGQTILATHHWPTTDPYSFTVHGQPWIAFEWLGDCLIATANQLWGVRGLDLLLIVMGSAVLVALYVLGTVRSGKSKAGFLGVALLCPLAFPSFTLRSQMLGYLLLAVTVVILEFFRQGKRWVIWVLPPLLLMWVNTHGSWIVGLGTILVYLACGLVEFRRRGIEAIRWSIRERRDLSVVFLLCLIAVTITPYGTRLAAFPFSVASSLPISFATILEWQPMPFQILGGKIFLALVLGFFFLQAAFDFTWRLEEWLLFLGATAMAVIHVRFILVFVPFFAPLLATVLARWIDSYHRTKDKYVLNGLLMAGVVIAMVHYFPTRANLEGKVADAFPVQAVEYLQQHAIPGPMFDSYGFGGYLIWSMSPQQKIFIDGRSEIYEHGGVLRDYSDLTQMKPGGLDVLRRYKIQSCLLERNEPLSVVLSALPDWEKIYSDHTGVLFVRRKANAASEPFSHGE